MLRTVTPSLPRVLAMPALVLGALACEGLTEPARSMRGSISLVSPVATVTPFAAGDSVGFQVMPRAGYRISIPIRFQNNTDSAFYIGWCPTFELVDADTREGLHNKCASALTTPVAIGPREVITTTVEFAACTTTVDDFHTVAAHGCFYLWNRDGLDGKFRLLTTMGPGNSLGSFVSWQVIQSPLFTLREGSFGLN